MTREERNAGEGKARRRPLSGGNMPYSITRRRNQYCVVKDDDGRVMGCHATREQAEAQLTALNIAERKYRVEERS